MCSSGLQQHHSSQASCRVEPKLGSQLQQTQEHQQADQASRCPSPTCAGTINDEQESLSLVHLRLQYQPQPDSVLNQPEYETAGSTGWQSTS